jgi:ABC-type Na+ efflux pump permease subunit
VPFLLSSAAKDLRRRLADPFALAILGGLPLVIGTLMGLMTGDGAATPRAHVLVTDQDQTLLSRLLADSSWGGFVETEAVELEDGRSRMDAGEATALLVLPEGFQSGVLEGRPVELRLLTNPGMRILPRLVQEGLEVLLEAVFYLQQLLGPELAELAEGVEGSGGVDQGQVTALAGRIYEQLDQVREVALPPVLDVELERVGQPQGPAPGFGELAMPGFLIMAVIFVAQIASDDAWAEKEQGTLRRALASPRGLTGFLGGKVLAAGGLVALVSCVGLAVAAALFGYPLRTLPGALLWCAFAGVALFALLLLIQLFASSRRAGSLLYMIVVFPLIMLGGSFFPFEAMPGWMSSVGELTPNGVAVVQLKDILLERVDPAALLRAVVALTLPAVGAFLLSLRRLRRFALA